MVAAERSATAPRTASGGAQAGALVLYGQRSDTPPRAERPAGCPKAAHGLRLAVKDLDGPRYLPVNCGRRDCSYCGRLKAFEDATVIFLDAREQQPTLAITLTTHQPWEQLDPEVYRQASARVWKALRKRYPDVGVEYVGSIEFTTGKAERSGGRRRMHGHYLVKGIDGGEVLAVEKIVRRVWEAATGAYIVEVSELRSAGGAIAYMALHHRKPEQAAPPGWRGMTLRASKGYWHRPIAELREMAKREQAIRRRRWQLEQEGIDPTAAALGAAVDVDAQREALLANGVELVRVREAQAPSSVVVPLGVVEDQRQAVQPPGGLRSPQLAVQPAPAGLGAGAQDVPAAHPPDRLPQGSRPDCRSPG